MATNTKNLPEQEQLLFQIEDVRLIEEYQEDVRIKKLCKRIRLALHILSEVTKDIKAKTPKSL
jgi:hypothetical protein